MTIITSCDNVLKKANKAERGRVKEASNLGEVIKMEQPFMQRRGEEWSRQRSQHMLRSQARRKTGIWSRKTRGQHGQSLVSIGKIDRHAGP